MINPKWLHYPCFLTIIILSKLPPKSRKWYFRDSLGLWPSFSAPHSKRASYGTACFCNMSVRKICVFLFVNCVFIFRIANTFVASYAIKYSKMFFVIRKFLAYTTQLYMLATALCSYTYTRKFHPACQDNFVILIYFIVLTVS